MSKVCTNCQGVIGMPGEAVLVGMDPKNFHVCQCRQTTQGRIDPKENVYPVQSAIYFPCPVCASQLRLTEGDLDAPRRPPESPQANDKPILKV